ATRGDPPGRLRAGVPYPPRGIHPFLGRVPCRPRGRRHGPRSDDGAGWGPRPGPWAGGYGRRHRGRWSMISQLADFATIASGIALTLSVLFVGYELRVNAKLARASNAQALVEISTSFISRIMQDRETARFWTVGHSEYREMDELDQFRYLTLMT